MDVSDAIRTAKNYVHEVFKEDGIEDVRTEEVEFDDQSGTWSITVGFVWDRGISDNPLTQILKNASGNRIYKVVRVLNGNGRPVSVKNRLFDRSLLHRNPARLQYVNSARGRSCGAVASGSA